MTEAELLKVAKKQLIHHLTRHEAITDIFYKRDHRLIASEWATIVLALRGEMQAAEGTRSAAKLLEREDMNHAFIEEMRGVK